MFHVLRNRNYLLYWIGSAISFTGSHLHLTVQGWYVYNLTGGSFAVGLVGFFGQLPMALTLLGGVVADRVNKGRLLMVTQSVMMVMAFLLGALVAKDMASVWIIVAIASVNGFAGAFDSPARHALAVHLVGKESLSSAIGLNSAAFNSARIIGPAIAGALLMRLGPASCFFINGLSYIAVIAALAAVKCDMSSKADGDAAIWSDLIAGLRYMKQDGLLTTLILMAGIPSLFVLPYQTIMPEFASEILKVEAAGYGVLMASVGAGALIGALRLAAIRGKDGRGRSILLAGLGSAAAMLMLAFTSSYWMAAGMLLAMGVVNVTYNATLNTVLQTMVDDQFRARVVSAYIFVFLGLSPIGNLLAGTLARDFGVRVPLIVGGIGVGMMMLIIAATKPAVRNL